MRSLVLTAAVAAALVLATPAWAVHRLPHSKPFREMTTSQVRDYLARQVWHDKTALRWLRTHHGRRQLASAHRREVRWFRTSLRIAQKNLAAKAQQLRAQDLARERAQLGDGAEFACIHGYEGAWNANTGNGYSGGLQMDGAFQRTYGSEFIARWGSANNWPVWAQVTAARRARDGYNGYPARGYSPWPRTARACGQR